VDDHLVDNRWGLEHRTQTVSRRFHAPRKDPRNPLIPGKGGYVNVARDPETGRFRMWYQEFWRQSPTRYTYGIAYAESEDGLGWKLPRIGKYDFKAFDPPVRALSCPPGRAHAGRRRPGALDGSGLS